MYRPLDVALMRAPAVRLDATARPWPDLTDHADAALTWGPWLCRVMRQPGFAAALEQASPSLVRRVQEICEGRPVPEAAARSAVLSVLRYVLRARGRATPFGLFAGVAPAWIGDTAAPDRLAGTDDAAQVGTAQASAVAQVDARWLEAVAERLETEPALRPRLTVRAAALAFERDDRLVLPHRPQRGERSGPVHVDIGATAPVRAAMALAAAPIRLADLAGKLAARFPRADSNSIGALLAGLVVQGFLITSLRPAMTATDPLRHLIDELDSVGAGDVPETALTVEQLHAIAAELRHHNTTPAPAASEPARDRRTRITTAMAALCDTPAPTLTIDLRLDQEVVVPRCVAEEAAAAAGALVRLAVRPCLPGWAQWHGRFLERFGPRALVPVRDAVDADVGLGYPAGFLGADPMRDETLTGRDVLLLALAQKAAMRRAHEIVLDEAMIDDLAAAPAGFADASARSGGRVPDRYGWDAQDSTELTVRVHAADEDALRRGLFTMAIVSASRTAGTATGRFLHLMDEPWPARFTEALASAEGRDVLAAQISAPPLHTGTQNVARAARVLPYVLPIGEHHDDGPDVITLDDVAVTADADRLYLVSLSRRKLLRPRQLNAVEPVRHTHPMVRFLVEAPHG